ncbi:MAG: GH92 family glycosyl hydrolase [Alistipes sp.]|nr:GH92 family glycosyl hydrolase [Alistipes sp.]
MKKSLNLIAGALLFASAMLSACAEGNSAIDYVDPKIGSGGHGHVFVGASVPFGLVQVGPTSIPQDWDWCSGYHSSDETVIGFSHTHLSGTGIGDLFDVTLMPVIGEVTYARGKHESYDTGMWSYADRTKEVASPYYYSVPLKRYGITAEMTATSRVGFHRYTFPASDDAAIVIDLENGGCWDKATEVKMEQESDTRIVGYRHSRGWANNQKVYFVADFSRPFDSFELVGNKMYGRVAFTAKENEQIYVKVALSPVSIEGAKANMEAELPGWNFKRTIAEAKKAWEKELSKMEITTTDEAAKRTFYTALYHTMIAPSEYCDVNGDYYGPDKQIHKGNGHTTYTTYSLWDTYRAAMPLMSIIQKERMTDIINTMLNIYDEQGILPVWHLWGWETYCMVGNPGLISVADAVVKGDTGIDKERAFEAIKKTAMHPGRGNAYRIESGFIPSDKMNQSIAYDMEYAIADAAAANAARALGKTEDAEYFENRSHSYRNYFDHETQFIRGRLSDGSWRQEFDPNHSSHGNDDYCEGNAWQYTWLVPHDIKGLQECFGSRETTLEKLDLLFTTSSEITGENASADISGLIGQYAHGNEPSHHVIYMYSMLGEPHKAADRVREVLTTLYFDAEEGLSGNEDVGQMSAWYIMSAMGFYEVEPASARYWFGSPLFDEVKINLAEGTFTIVAENNSAENKYIQRVWLNGEPYEKGWISHSDIKAGGVLKFEMGSTPQCWYEVE